MTIAYRRMTIRYTYIQKIDVLGYIESGALEEDSNINNVKNFDIQTVMHLQCSVTTVVVFKLYKACVQYRKYTYVCRVYLRM